MTRYRTLFGLLTSVAIGAAAVAGAAHAIEIEGPPACLPVEENAPIAVTLPASPDTVETRLYFRRLNPLGAFYYVNLHAAGENRHWTVFPKPEDREQQELTDDWYDVLKDRDWLQGHDRDWLEEFMEEQEFEAAEYYVTTVDSDGEETGRTPTQLVRVLEQDDCEIELTEHEIGWSENLTVGETTDIQPLKPVFHWLCDGIVTRIDWTGIYRADEFCRACVVAALPIPPIVATTAATGVVIGVIVEDDVPREASPRQP